MISQNNIGTELSLTRISYKQINSKFSYGKYGEFKVILMNSNGYINATKLCALAGKHFFHWMGNKQSKGLITEIEKELSDHGIPLPGKTTVNSGQKSMITITTGSKTITETRGTYVHPLLVPHVASWCSPKFAISVSKIVNNFLIKDFEKQKRLELNEKNGIIDELNETLRQMNAKLDSMSNTMDSVKVELTETKEELIDTKGELIETKEEIIETNYKLDTIQDKLEIAVEDRVPKLTKRSKQETFVVIKVSSTSDNDYDYYAIRGQKGYVESKKTAFLVRNKGSRVLKTISYQPNPRNLYIRLKQNLKDKIEFSLNWFSVKDFTDQDLIETINELNSEKYNV